MERNFYQDDEFEQFLQDEVKQHRMYPSDQIWKNIRTEIHGYRSWPALTFISLFIITALTISTLLNNHPVKQVFVPVTNAAPVTVSKATVSGATTRLVADKNKDYFQQLAAEQITAETFADLNLNEIVIPEIIINRNDIAAAPVSVRNNARNATNGKSNTAHTVIPDAPPANIIENTLQPATAIAAAEAEKIQDKEAEKNTVTDTEKHSTADDFLKDFHFTESRPAKKNSRFGFQVYITPSTSYRRLSDEKVKDVIQPAIAASNAVQNVPLNANATADVNNVVRHKPAIGFELGFSVLYNMTGRLKFKTGIQLNVRQYYIETFQSLTNDLASLALINYRGVETISFYSPYNNNTGYKKTQLDNKVYQLSVPIGIQWDMIKGKHLGISTDASVQPTLTLNNNTYLLSTDYKHYTGGADFIRKWNINTSVGINLTYTNGVNSWQLGPQIRYQHLPTYSNLYPIKEYLMDYGIRLGFTRQIR